MNSAARTSIALLGLFVFSFSIEAQVVISEIHYHPVEQPAFNNDGTPFFELTNDVHEFVEIQNATGSAVDVSGWRLSGGISFTFPTGTTIDSGAFLVIAKDPVRLATVYSLNVTNVLGPYSGYLGNNGDTVRLKDLSGNTIDSVTYDSVFPWAASADALGAQDMFTGLSSTNYQYKGRSLQRVSVSWLSNDPANWLASPLTGPTPGAAQSATRTIPKPVVIAKSASQTSDGASIVRSNQSVTLTCSYSATNNLSNVTLEYFLDDINSTSEAHYTQAMTDLGGGKYSAIIPGQTNRTIVRYRFKADRGDGLEVVSPRADDPQIAPIGTGGAREAWWGYFVTPVRTTTNAAIYDVFVSTSSLTSMGNNISQNPKRVTAATATGLPRDIPYVAATAPQWNGTVPGVFCNDGKVWDIQIRYHGSRYHRATSNHSYKLHFPEHLMFNGHSSWFETLHGTEFVEAQKINRLLGVPASAMRRVDWYLNSGANEIHSEEGEYDGEMLDDWHALQQQLNPGSKKEQTGDLYKDVGNRDATQNNLEGPYTRGDCAPMLVNAGWSQLQRYDWTFALQNNFWKGSKPIRDLVEGMWAARGDSPSTHTYTNTAASVPAVKAWFTNNWDMDEVITSMALLEWMSIWDDAAQNCFYWRRASGKWGRLGWDYDGVMTVGSGGLGGGTNQTIYGGEYGAPTVFDGVNWFKDTFYKTFRAEYNQRLWELNNSFFDPTNLSAQGLTRAASFAVGRRAYISTQLASLGSFYKPNRPVNVYPTNTAAIATTTNFITSAYSHPQNWSHFATLWEMRSANGDYEDPVLRVTTTNSFLTNYPIPFDQLTYGKTYYWRATFIDTNNHPSIVSAETSFSWGTTNTAAGTLVLNEILADNRTTVAVGSGFPDYIELYNNGNTDLSLAGYSLTDNTLNPTKYVFPAGTTISAGGYLLVWCDNDTNSAGLHAGFNLDSAGQTVLLMQNTNTIVDSVTFGPQAPDVSIGRIVNGTGGWQANTPTPLTANSAKTLGSVSNLKVNEWLADPAYGEDWFEIYNSDSNVVALAGLYLSDTPSTPKITKIPALSFIAGNGYQRFWADGQSSGNNHANFKLSKSGENLLITAANGTTPIDTITFGAQTTDVAQGRLPDGSGNIVSFSSQTASPGYPNWAPAAVYLNEILAHGHPPLEDAIEIYNPNTTNVNIGGWWLSDDRLSPKKYQIPLGTIVPAKGYFVAYEGDFNSGATPFAFSAWGDEVALSAADGSGALNGYGSIATFGPSPRHQSFGRIAATGLGPDSNGAEYWALTGHTFGQDNPPDTATFRTGTGLTNDPPIIGPVVINEIMYHPPDVNAVDDTQDEFIELFNVTSTNVNLSGWKLRGDTSFVFPANTYFAANGYLLLVSFDPSTNAATVAAFRATNNVSESTPIFGPYSDKLANSTFKLELTRPDILDDLPVNYLADKVTYRDIAPWPTTPDGGGTSLQRTSIARIGVTAANWIGATPTPGAINYGVTTNAITITTPSPLPGGVVGVPYTNNFTATGGTLPYSWAIVSGSIDGLTLAANGTLEGVPTTAAATDLLVKVTDNAGKSVTNSFNLVVASSPLSITTTSPLPEATLNSLYIESFAATGGTEPYVWNLISGLLPGGLTFYNAGILGGTPTNHGTFNFTIQIADSGGLAVTQSFSLTVPVLPLAITTTSSMVNGQQGLAYSQALTGAGGVTPYTWNLDDGTLPPGLSLSSLGDITGTPTAPGTYNFTVRLTDSASVSATKLLSIKIVSPTLTVATEQLPDSTNGLAYYQTLAATGGATPYSWSLIWGALPDGLTLNSAGFISGTLTTAGTFSFILQVTDNASATNSKMFTVGVAPIAPMLTVQGFAANTLQLLVSGDSSLDYSIQSSTNFVDWETIFSTNIPAMPFNWSDSGATNEMKFYRAFFTVPVDP